MRYLALIFLLTPFLEAQNPEPATLVVINVAWQGPIAWAAQAARRWLLTPAVADAIARGTGLVLLVFAALMLYEHFG